MRGTALFSVPPRGIRSRNEIEKMAMLFCNGSLRLAVLCYLPVPSSFPARFSLNRLIVILVNRDAAQLSALINLAQSQVSLPLPETHSCICVGNSLHIKLPLSVSRIKRLRFVCATRPQNHKDFFLFSICSKIIDRNWLQGVMTNVSCFKNRKMTLPLIRADGLSADENVVKTDN